MLSFLRCILTITYNFKRNIHMTEEMFEDDPRALTEQDNKRYIPKPYMDFFLALRYTADDDEIKTPAGVNADYRGYG